MFNMFPLLHLQSWTKALGQIYICGAFSNALNSRAQIPLLLVSPSPPAPHLQCWTRVQNWNFLSSLVTPVHSFKNLESGHFLSLVENMQEMVGKNRCMLR